MDTLHEIRQFLSALVRYWAALATGGTIMAANWAYHGLKGTQQGKIEFDILAFLFFVMATYLAWRDQKKFAQETLTKIGNLEKSHSEQMNALRARLQNESFKMKEQMEHDRRIFERLISFCDEITFRDVCSGIGYDHYYDREHFRRITRLEHYSILDENQFVNQDLREAFQKFHRSLDAFTTIVARYFFNTTEDRYMLYPDLKNSGDPEKRRRFEDAATETKNACDTILAAFSEFRQTVKRLLYM